MSSPNQPNLEQPSIDPDWRSDLQELSTAEDFLHFFAVEYTEHTLHVNRLHVLQRFHHYLATDSGIDSGSPTEQWNAYRKWLTRAYQDFVESDARTEKVFRVFQHPGGCHDFVSIDSLACRASKR
jgi:nitrogenase-stabilizing/protective protein